MIEVLIAGLALGAVYALASGGLMLTYLSSGVLNFAYAAIAFFVARFYYFLHVQHNWNIAPAAIVSVVLAGPALGAFLWIALFRFIRLASQLVKVVVTIGLSVSLPAVTTLLFGNIIIGNPPGLAPEPVATFRVFGSPITLDEIIIYACGVLILGGGWLLLRLSSAGLLVRAVVDSDAMASLSGIRPSRVAMAVWTASTFTAGLVGVLSAPIFGLSADSMAVLLAASFAAAVAGRLRSIAIPVCVGLLIGVATQLVERYLPSTSQLTADLIPSIPFIFLVLFLLYWASRGYSLRESQSVGGPLDHAIAPHGGSEMALAHAADVARKAEHHRVPSNAGAIGLVLIAVAMAFVLHGVWIESLGLGLAFAIILLSYTVSAGQGGMIWLCQITFAGTGAFTTAELATKAGWPVLAALIVGGMVSALLGAVISMVTVRLGDLYIALVTLTVALLFDDVVFQIPSLNNFGAGVAVSRPSFAQGDRGFVLLALAGFVILSLIFVNLRRSTFGLAVSAVRWSESGARLTGLSVARTKIPLSIFAAFIAGIGGGFIALYTLAATPASFATSTGLVWLAVLVTVGSRNSSAALVAGLSLSFIPEAVAAYLPVAWGQVPPALFGLGAMLVARNPDGTIAMHARQLEQLLSRRKSQSAVQLLVEQTVEVTRGVEPAVGHVSSPGP